MGTTGQQAFTESRISDVLRDFDDDGFLDYFFSSNVRGPNNRPEQQLTDATITRISFGPDRTTRFDQRAFSFGRYNSRNALAPGWRPEAISSFDVDNDGLEELMTTNLGTIQTTGQTYRESQFFTNRRRPEQGTGSRFADAGDLPPCACGTFAATGLGQEGAPTATFDVQPGGDCRVTRVDLDVEAVSGDGRPAALDLLSPAEDSARLIPHGGVLPEGRWNPNALSGLARFEGSVATGAWILRSRSAACAPGDDACTALHRLSSASLRLNCAPADPLDQIEPAPACTDDLDPGGLVETACAWAPEQELSGAVADANDRDRLIVVGPARGGFALDTLVALSLSVESAPAPRSSRWACTVPVDRWSAPPPKAPTSTDPALKSGLLS